MHRNNDGYKELEGLIIKMGFTIDEVSEKTGISASALKRKIMGKSDFRSDEAKSVMEFLMISGEDADRILFPDFAKR